MTLHNPRLWQPSAQQINDANITSFMRYVSEAYKLSLQNYDELYTWSVEQPALFWQSVWEFCDIKCSTPWQDVLTSADKMPGAHWFSGARLNFAENLLCYRDDDAAIIFKVEDSPAFVITHNELYDKVSQLSAALRDAGVGVGDRVAGFMPNIPETLMAMLATASLGAIWSSCSPDFGTAGAVERFGQIQPKVLFCCDGYFFKGNRVDSIERIREVSDQIPSIEKIVVVDFTQQGVDVCFSNTVIRFEAFIRRYPAGEIVFEQLSFDHPLYILYSSGTTGLPKCIVHSAGGTLIQHLKEHVLHTNIKHGDRLFYYTTCGWMMWNWLASGLASGATLVLYEGSPFHPNPNILWRYAEEAKINVFGTSAKYLSALEKAGVKPKDDFDLSSLRCLLSTGSPLLPESFDYVYRDIKSDIQLSSISGGTDIVSCFALGCPILPVYKDELQCRGLGMKVAVYNEQGQAIAGEFGELVCEAPAPSMPIGFWNDDDGSRYQQAYFSRFPGIWTHGDYAFLTEHNGLIITGRSDAVLNPGGVRIGTAEIYRQVEKVDDVLEAIAVGQDWQGDVRIILFVRLRDGVVLDKTLVDHIKSMIRANETPRHVPAKIIQVADIPRTISGKLVELAVRNVIHKRPVLNVDALANPEALALFKDLAELES